MVYRRDFLDLLVKRPTVAIRIIELLCERIRWMSAQMEERALLPLETRLAHRLVALSEDFGSDLHVSQEELAIFVGATRESVNRQLQTWRREGWIELSRNRIRVLQPARLWAPAGADGPETDEDALWSISQIPVPFPFNAPGWALTWGR